MKAIMDRVFVRLRKKNEAQYGILMPDNFEEGKNVGEVISVGPEVKAVNIGDVVMFHAFDELPTLKKDVVVLRERSLLGVME